MKRFALTAAGIASAAVAGAANADVTINFDTGADPAGFPGGTVIEIGQVSGTLTGMSITANFYDATSGGVWASDLLVAVSDGTSLGGISWGGFDLGFGLTDGGGFSWGQSVFGVYSSSFSGYSMAVTSGSVLIANGWSASLGGSWSGSITLYGVNAVPAPGALALLGLAGLAGRRRRN